MWIYKFHALAIGHPIITLFHPFRIAGLASATITASYCLSMTILRITVANSARNIKTTVIRSYMYHFP